MSIQTIPARTEHLARRILQPSHGFTLGQFVFLNNATSPAIWDLAQADLETTTSLGMVVNPNPDYFDLIIAGRVEWSNHGLNTGRFYYLSPDNPGSLTPNPPGQDDTGSPGTTTDLIIPALKVIDDNSVQIIFQGPSGGAASASATFGYTREDFNTPQITSGEYWQLVELFAPEHPTAEIELILDANVDTGAGIVDTTLRLRVLVSVNGSSDEETVISLAEHESNAAKFPFDQLSIVIDDVNPNIYRILLRASSEITEIRAATGRSFIFYRSYNQDGELLAGTAPANNLAPIAFDSNVIIQAVTDDMDAYMPLWGNLTSDLEGQYASQGYMSLEMSKSGQSPGGWSWVNTKAGPFVFNTMPTFRGTPLVDAPQSFEFGEANSNTFGVTTIQFIDPNTIDNRFAAFYADNVPDIALLDMNLNDIAGSGLPNGARPTNSNTDHDESAFNFTGNWEQDGNNGFRINSGVGTHSMNWNPVQHQSDIVHFNLRWSGAPADGIQAIAIAGARERIVQNPITDAWFIRRDGNDLTMDQMVASVFQNINPQVVPNFFLGIPDYTPVDLWVLRRWDLNTDIAAPTNGDIYQAQTLVVYTDSDLSNEIMRIQLDLSGSGKLIGAYHQTSFTGSQNVSFGNITTHFVPADHYLQAEFLTGIPGPIPNDFLGATESFTINAEGNIECLPNNLVSRTIQLEPADPFGTSYQFECEFRLANDDGNAGILINHDTSATMYLNPELAGGSRSGPADGNNPPNNHTIGFNTVISQPVQISPGVFQWDQNSAEAFGRCYFAYNFHDASNNSSNFIVGRQYTFSVEIENLSALEYDALGFSNVTNVTIDNLDSLVQPGTTKTVSMDFTIDADGWTIQARYGVGITIDTDHHLIIRNPDVRETGSNTNQNIESSGFLVAWDGAQDLIRILSRSQDSAWVEATGAFNIPYNILGGQEWHKLSILVHDRPPMNPADFGTITDDYDDDLVGSVFLNGIPLWTGTWPTAQRGERIFHSCGVLNNNSPGTEYRNLRFWSCHHANYIPNTVDDSAIGDQGRKEIGIASNSSGWMLVPRATYNGRSGYFLEGKWAADLQFNFYAGSTTLRTFAFCGTWFRLPDDVADTGRASLFRGLSGPNRIGDVRRNDTNGLFYALSTGSQPEGYNSFYIPGGASNAENGTYVPHAAVMKSDNNGNVGFIGGQVINGDNNNQGASSRARLMGNPMAKCLCLGFALFQYSDPTDAEYQQVELSMIDYLRN